MCVFLTDWMQAGNILIQTDLFKYTLAHTVQQQMCPNADDASIAVKVGTHFSYTAYTHQLYLHILIHKHIGKEKKREHG